MRDILNREVVTITDCENEPIHIPGSIQPHGFLLGVTAQGLIIEYCSGNISSFSNFQPSRLLGKHLSAFMGVAQLAGFEQYVQQFTSNSAQPFCCVIDDVPFNTTVHYSEDVMVLEMEPFPDGSLSLPDLYMQTQKFVSFLQNAHGMQQLSRNVAEETRSITGYDRVMVYRFDAQYNGEIFAESKKEDLPSFLGHHYPHTDIPSQARELYLRNLLRIIADVQYEPVPIYIRDENKDKNLDLSHSILRSVSPIHIQYLKNMGVQATLTISLVLEGRLWGLIACHHYSPKLLPHYTRLSAQLQAHFLTSQIRVQETAEEYAHAQKIEKGLNTLLQLLGEKEDFLSTCNSLDLLHTFINAGGTVIIKDKTICSSGTVPGNKQVKLLHKWILSNTDQDWWHTSRLSDSYSAAAAFIDKGAGILYHSLGKEGDCIIWFRPEVVEAVEWAGNPSEAVIKDRSSGRLSPRTSFELWKEEVKGQSQPWRNSELQAAISLAYSLQKQIHLYYLHSFTTQLQSANEELENFNWIGAHDLNEPLRKIKLFASIILTRPPDEISPAVLKSVGRIEASGNRMQALINDLLAYSAIKNGSKTLAPADLNELIKDVLIQLKETIEEKQAIITTGNLPTLMVIREQVTELFRQVIINALKFSREDETSRISINYRRVRRKKQKTSLSDVYHRISIRDNGQGFDPVYRTKIFRIFQRLHTGIDNTGTGTGLAISKKIMDNHNGFIRTNSKEGAGATFMLYFPVTEEDEIM